MSESQRHGFEFERLIREAGEALKQSCAAASENIGLCEPGQSPPPQSYTARFDIAASQDPIGQSIPTCIKLAKRGANGRVRVDMADARRTIALADQPLTRLVIGVFDQVGAHKHVNEVREYLIAGGTWVSACGGADPAVIAQFHHDLAHGTPPQAKAFGKARKAELAAAHPSSTLQWSPKVDSKKQRRLQCSLYLDDLDRLVAQQQDSVAVHRPDTVPLWGVALPVQIASPPRERKKKPKPEPPEFAEQ